jgi:hypothetical protein
VVAVTVTAGADVQPPTVPTLLSATAISATEVDLAWTASSDNIGVAGYQIIRDGSAIASIPGPALTYADTTEASATIFAVKAYDGAGIIRMPVTVCRSLHRCSAVSGTCPAPAINAFTGCYYSNMTLSGNPVFVRTTARLTDCKIP